MLTQPEFTAILTDPGKRIEGDIAWQPDPGHPGAMVFRVTVLSDAGYPLFIDGRYRRASSSLAYTLIHAASARIYAINFGHHHTNPTTRERVGIKHKHYWTAENADRMAYNPADITEPWHRPVAVWRQFCAEARIEHRGIMHTPD